MKAGALRDRVVILERENEYEGLGQDAHGHVDSLYPAGWTPIPSLPDGGVWAEVRPLTSREYVWAGGTQSEISHMVRTRYIEGVHERCKIYLRKDGRVLNVAEMPRRVIGDRRIMLEFSAKEVEE